MRVKLLSLQKQQQVQTNMSINKLDKLDPRAIYGSNPIDTLVKRRIYKQHYYFGLVSLKSFYITEHAGIFQNILSITLDISISKIKIQNNSYCEFIKNISPKAIPVVFDNRSKIIGLLTILEY